MLKFTNMTLNACAGYAKDYAPTFHNRMMHDFHYWIMQEVFAIKSWDKYVSIKNAKKSIVGQLLVNALYKHMVYP